MCRFFERIRFNWLFSAIWFLPSGKVVIIVYQKARFIKSKIVNLKVLYLQASPSRRLNLRSIPEMILLMSLGNHLMMVVLIKTLRSGTENLILQTTNGNRSLLIKTQSVAKFLCQLHPASTTSVWGRGTIKVTVDLHMLLKLGEEATRRQMVLFWNKFQVRVYN